MSNFSTHRNETARQPVAAPASRRRQANLERLLTAALEIVSEDGFSALTLGRVAERTDYTRAALYRYFDSKEALISALTIAVIGDLVGEIHAVLSGAGRKSALARVRLVTDEYREFAHRHPEKFGMLSSLMADSRALLPKDTELAPALASLEQALDVLGGLLREATEAGALRKGDSSARAAVLFSSVHGVLQLRKQSARSSTLKDTKALCKLAVDSLLAGWSVK